MDVAALLQNRKLLHEAVRQGAVPDSILQRAYELFRRDFRPGPPQKATEDKRIANAKIAILFLLFTFALIVIGVNSTRVYEAFYDHVLSLLPSGARFTGSIAASFAFDALLFLVPFTVSYGLFSTEATEDDKVIKAHVSRFDHAVLALFVLTNFVTILVLGAYSMRHVFTEEIASAIGNLAGYTVTIAAPVLDLTLGHIVAVISRLMLTSQENRERLFKQRMAEWEEKVMAAWRADWRVRAQYVSRVLAEDMDANSNGNNDKNAEIAQKHKSAPNGVSAQRALEVLVFQERTPLSEAAKILRERGFQGGAVRTAKSRLRKGAVEIGRKYGLTEKEILSLAELEV